MGACALRQRFAGQPVAVCLELAKGPLVYAVQKYDFLVLFPVPPATLAKYREAFVPSHAKADPSDAQFALELLLRYRAKLRPLTPQSVPMRALLRLVEQRRRLVGDQSRISNRLTDALKQYFPDVLAWFANRDTRLFCDFLSRWPTLKQLQRARKATLLAFFHDHHVRSQSRIDERLQAIKSAVPLTDDPAVILPNQLLVQALVEQLRLTLQAIERFDAEIAGVAPVERVVRPLQRMADSPESEEIDVRCVEHCWKGSVTLRDLLRKNERSIVRLSDRNFDIARAEDTFTGHINVAHYNDVTVGASVVAELALKDETLN